MYHHTQCCWRAVSKLSSRLFSRFPVHWLVQNKRYWNPNYFGNVCVNLGELFANYCKRGYLWKLLLLLVLLLLLRLQWLTARFTGTEKNILLLRLLLLWRKATHILYFIPQCLMQLYMHLHWCYLHICRHCLWRTAGFVNFYQYHLISKVSICPESTLCTFRISPDLPSACKV